MLADRSFCVFILSHGRPDRVITVNRLREGNYSGPWFLVIDNEDTTRQAYIDRYGADHVVVFDKAAAAQTFDTADLSDDRRTVVFARNACFAIARSLGYDYFLELDDDYSDLRYRFDDGDGLGSAIVTSADALFSAMLDFLDESGAATVALAQGGDLIGGADGTGWRKKILRKAMNSFFCRTSDDWRFIGRINEDVNTYTALAHRGEMFFTTAYAWINQRDTQSSGGGMTDVYLDGGTYAKSFYPVMMCPSAVRIGTIQGGAETRTHHAVERNNCVPKILPEYYRKAAD